ncbi:MAG: hypothetical protein JWP63_6214, partial [Candidatus Solibacter sp.]|nr:hypothetical protein [Candidatus Solibacter sp.]
VGKLSDLENQQTNRELQKELASERADDDRIRDKLKMLHAATVKMKVAKHDPFTCPHCSAHFEKELKFCGECGKPMKAVNV